MQPDVETALRFYTTGLDLKVAQGRFGAGFAEAGLAGDGLSPGQGRRYRSALG